MKPETPHDEDLAKVSREARLTFIYLWTICDDAGYFRASLKYLVGVLYPYDEDVTPKVLKRWLRELAGIGCIAWAKLKDGAPVGYVPNFPKHQRIDHPSRSFFAEHLATDSRDTPEGAPKGVSESLVSESLSPESLSKTLVPRSGTYLEALCAGTANRKEKERALDIAAEVVFVYWQARCGHPRAILDKKRTVRIIARLRENGGDVSELLDAIDGALRDDFLMGRDGKSPRVYDGIETLYRDRAQVERLVQLANVRRGDDVHHPFLNQKPADNGPAADSAEA